MNQTKQKMKSEQGITLISLLITIMILVILSSVAIKVITGDESIIGATEVSAENYKIVSYKEQIEHNVRGTILKKATMGEVATLEDIAEGLRLETNWVKSAYANIGESITQGDVIVTTLDGYMFQVYYDAVYGTVYVEYIGKDDGKDGEKYPLPNITGRYEKSIASIIANTSIEKGKVEKVEVIYKSEVVETRTDTDGEMRINIEKYGTGMYTLRAVSDKGKIRCTWVRATNISDKLTPPEIVYTPARPESGWWRSEVTIDMITESPSATEVHYVLTGTTEKGDTKTEGKTANVTINSKGLTKITAWTEDGKGYRSEVVEKEIRIDPDKPSISHTEECSSNKVGYWYKGPVTIGISGTDEHSGVIGYEYKVTGEHTDFIQKTMEEKLRVEKEGITEIKARTIDLAGNKSDEKTITIHKDTTPPDTARVVFKSNTISSITVTATGNDNQSGVSGYIFEYRPEGANSTDWRRLSNARVTTTKGTTDYTYNVARGKYSVRVIVIDTTGNEKISEILNTNTILNRAPVLTDPGSIASYDRTSMTIKATATDEDGGTLTYELYFGTSSGSLSRVDTKTGNAGSQVTFGARTGLAMNTTYYFRVDVTDGIDRVTGTVKSGKTKANSAPTFTAGPTGTTSNINTITITATGSDPDGDKLTYKLTWSENSNYSGATTSTVTGNSGAAVTVATKTGLASNKKTYYWKVEVYDNYGGTLTKTGNTATWCRTYLCSEFSNREVTCFYCTPYIDETNNKKFWCHATYRKRVNIR